MIDFLRKGNTYQLTWQLTDSDDTIVTADKVDTVQFIVGNIVKYYPTDVVYSTIDEAFVLGFTQEDTFAFTDNAIRCQARVKYKDKTVDATDIFNVNIKNVLTKVIL